MRALSSLSPTMMVTNPDLCRSNFRKITGYLCKANRLAERDCDLVIGQYDSFLDAIPTMGSSDFVNFKRKVDRLDTFILQRLHDLEKYGHLVKVVRILLVLSHGQAAVERGFSVNKEVEVKNLQAKSLVAQSLVCDYVTSCGGVLEVPLTKELLQSVQRSRQRYSIYLEEQRQLKKTSQQNMKRQQVMDGLESLKKRQKLTEEDIDSLEKSADDLALKAEMSGGSLKQVKGLVAQANAMRQSAKLKKQSLNQIRSDIQNTQAEVKEL